MPHETKLLTRPDGRPYTFLLIDDSEAILQLLESVLDFYGGEVVGKALDGSQAVELFRRLSPDLVICDIVLPGLGGIEVLKALLRMDPDLGVILCSADGHIEMVKTALANGARYFLVKPFTAKDLLKAILKVTRQGIPNPPGQ